MWVEKFFEPGQTKNTNKSYAISVKFDSGHLPLQVLKITLSILIENRVKLNSDHRGCIGRGSK